MLIDDVEIRRSLRNIAAKLAGDPALQDDLVQEGLIRLWRLADEMPGQTRSWYLQNCRFHLRHWMGIGRSVDSPKRAGGNNRISFDEVGEELPADWYYSQGEPLESVSARDIVSTLTRWLQPRESAVLGGLADGLLLQDIATKLNLSYPTALKYRRKIAALTVKLGICLRAA